MKAMVYRRYGGSSVLEPGEVETPAPQAGEVLIRVAASSINPIDWKQASGSYRLLLPAKWPMIPGFDVAGTVERLGPGVTEFSVGARVHARLGNRLGGASAELVCAGVGFTARMPEAMSFEEAAALPLAAMTALQGLRRAAVPKAGRVLVIGASGGVGHFAVQLARISDAETVGVCSARNAEFVRGLGATSVIDYHSATPFAGVAPFDVILDCVGCDTAKYLPLLTVNGRYASTIPAPGLFVRSAFNLVTAKKALPVMLSPNAADLRELDALWVRGALKVAIDSRYRLETLPQAWERSMSGRAVGKIVVLHDQFK